MKKEIITLSDYLNKNQQMTSYTRKTFEQIDEIKKFLADNPQLKHEDAATMLTLSGYPMTGRTVYDYRNKYKIPYRSNHLIKSQFEKDIRAGVTFSKVEEIQTKYDVCRSYARRLMKFYRNIDKKVEQPIRITDKVVKRQELPPVRVNSMAHLLTQLTGSADILNG